MIGQERQPAKEPETRIPRRRRIKALALSSAAVLILATLAAVVQAGAARSTPVRARERYEAAASKYRSGDTAGSIETLAELVERYPDFNEARALLGRALALSGDPETASANLRAVVREDPADRLSLLWLARVEVAVGDEAGIASTIAAIEEVMLRDDGDARLFHALGILQEQQGDVTSALASFERAAHQLRSDARVHLDLGRAYYRLGLESRARASLEEAAALAGPGPVAAAADSLLATMLLRRRDREGTGEEEQPEASGDGQGSAGPNGGGRPDGVGQNGDGPDGAGRGSAGPNGGGQSEDSAPEQGSPDRAPDPTDPAKGGQR